MPTGFIKTIKLAHGFGFIAEHNSDREHFFHVSDLSDLEWTEQLLERLVRFDVTTDRTGKTRAVHVRAE